MRVRIGRWEIGIAAALGAAAAWLLEWPPVVSAAAGVILVPLVAVAGGGVRLSPRHSAPLPSPPRGLCDCGHPMSMHCGSDSSGPCATAECRCAGSADNPQTQ
jgi:hypothetical protein